MAKNPNPQGKGVVPVLDDLRGLQLRPGGHKTPSAFLRDYFVSSLVLSARFRFRPVRGRYYFLYAAEPQWLLSLVAPAQWRGALPGAFVGRCRLRDDMTWELETSALEDVPEVSREVLAFIDDFVARITTQGSVSDSLPFYLATLPYQQRMLATALAASLQRSLHGNGDAGPMVEDVDLLLENGAALRRLLGPDQAAS
jgi:hypothetical protein